MGYVVIGALCVSMRHLDGAQSTQMHDIYKKVTNDLIEIKKQYPTTQPKVYAILDHVDKLFTTVKTSEQKKLVLEKSIQDKVAENIALKQELATLRGDISSARKSLESAKVELNKKMDEHRSQAQQLVQERKDLLGKLNAMELKQSKDKMAKSEGIHDIDQSL